ncbi:MAG: LacI family DNA-binding transcriptional regulator [Bradyrhizobiaceae bacterium]|nr:LacI family DNA-binding transcriptional regulator [Bradyrhizobiaceae bacterium]
MKARARKSRGGRPTLKDIARKVGVHVSTVSRALDVQTSARLAPKLVEKIRRAALRSGYKPNPAARALKTRKSRTIGVVIPDIADPAFPPIIRGIEDGLARNDYVAIVASTDGNPWRQQRILEAMRARGVDGLILAGVLRTDAMVSKLTAGIPVTTVIRQTDASPFSTVLHDEDGGIRLALAHLVSLGHRSIATIAGPQSFSTGYNRHAAFNRHAELLGVRSDPPLTAFARAFNEAEGERCAEELLVTGRPFTAIICANDRLAIGAIAALRRHSLRCPEDISVTGFNDMPLVDRLSPALTTVRVQHFQAGIEAAEIIVDMVEKNPVEPRHTILPVELVVRESTRRLSHGRMQRAENLSSRVE